MQTAMQCPSCDAIHTAEVEFVGENDAVLKYIKLGCKCLRPSIVEQMMEAGIMGILELREKTGGDWR